MVPARAKEVILKYRRRMNMFEFSNGREYDESTIDLEDTTVGGEFYGRSAQSNVELMGILTDVTNSYIDRLALAGASKLPLTSGHFLTYGFLESYIPEMFKSVGKTVNLQNVANQTLHIDFDITDFGYPCAFHIHVVDPQNALNYSPGYETRFLDATPATQRLIHAVMRDGLDENYLTPYYNISPSVDKILVNVTLTGDVSELYSADLISIGIGATELPVETTFYYIARQKPIDFTHDLSLSNRHDDYLIALMSDLYDKMKK